MNPGHTLVDRHSLGMDKSRTHTDKQKNFFGQKNPGQAWKVRNFLRYQYRQIQEIHGPTQSSIETDERTN